MKAIPATHTYNVALFDVLGFSDRLKTQGIEAIAQKYAILAKMVQRQNKNYEEYFGAGFSSSAFWTNDGDIVALQPCEAAYASDSLVLWSHSYFPAARDLPEHERSLLAKDRISGWEYAPVPCDFFLTICCEVVCLSLECGLPLRGAISTGRAIMDRDSGFFLGEPLVEAARLEKAQAALGLSLCSSFVKQHVPVRFTATYKDHIKREEADIAWSERVLAWNRYWKHTREHDCREVIERLSVGSGPASHYYTNTLRMLRSIEDSPMLKPEGVRNEYPQFSSPKVKVRTMAVRTINTLPS